MTRVQKTNGNRAGRPPRPRWTEAELDVIREHFPTGGAPACMTRLAGRDAPGIKQKAWQLGLANPITPATMRITLDDGAIARLFELRAQGWGDERIGRELGYCETTITNARLRAECVRQGFTPAKRDSAGAVCSRDVKRMRAMMMSGVKSCDIQLQLALSAGCVASHRRKFLAELKEQRKGRTLPRPGGGIAYSGARVPRAKRLEVERLYMEGLGALKIHQATGVSKTVIIRIRKKLVCRLARKGQALPGCDLAGVRRKQADSHRFIPPDAIAELRRRILARQPVARAAAELAIGGSRAYAIRDQLAAELAARGETLPRPERLARAQAKRENAKANWLPKGMIYRYRALLREYAPDEAKRVLLEQLATERQAEARRPKSFAEQLAAAAAGAPLIEKIHFRRPDPTMTLGGVATGAL